MIRNLVFDMGNVLIHYIPQVFMDRLGVPAEDQPLLAREGVWSAGKVCIGTVKGDLHDIGKR